MTATTTGRRPSRVTLSARRAEQWAGVVLASPALLVFTVFMFVPLVMTVWYSLNRYSGFGRMRFLGLDNYRQIAGDPTFWQSLLNTAVLTAITVPLGIVLGLGAALLLNRALPARGLFRALVYVPVVISGVAAGMGGASGCKAVSSCTAAILSVRPAPRPGHPGLARRRPRALRCNMQATRPASNRRGGCLMGRALLICIDPWSAS